ncbi:hypothetical protein ACG7TL_005797 [Trametes sanguinea]
MSFSGGYDVSGMESWGEPSSAGMPSDPSASSSGVMDDNLQPGSVPQAETQPTAAPPAPDMSDIAAMRQLLESVVALGQSTATQQEIQRLQGRALEILVDRLEHNPPVVNPAPASWTAPPALSGPSVKAPDPRKFTGKASEVEPFLREVEAVISLQPGLRTDSAKCTYFSLFLGDGSPQSWFTALRLKQPELMHNWPALVAAFRKRFEDPDLVMKYLHKLESLTQTGSAAAYANQFEEYLSYLDWTPKMAITQFDCGLKPDLLLTLVTKDRPPTLTEWIPIVVDADNQLHNLQVEARQRGKQPSKPSSSATRTADRSTTSRTVTTTTTASASMPTTTTSASNDVVPMEVDAIKHGKLTAAERERRRKEGLCFYCGQGKHRISECPNMSEAAKKNCKATPASGKA